MSISKTPRWLLVACLSNCSALKAMVMVLAPTRLNHCTTRWASRWFSYNNQVLPSTVTSSPGTEQNAVFDIEDRPLYVTDANAVTVTNTLDLLGRLTRRGYPDGGLERFGYSAPGLTAYTNQLGLTNFLCV